MPDSPRPATPDPRPSRTHGGRRPGAGARRGNLNALKAGRYSKRVQALKGVMKAMPRHLDLLDGVTGRDKHKVETLAYALIFYGEILLHVAAGGSIHDLTEAEIRDRVIAALPDKQTQRIVDALQRSFGVEGIKP